MRKIIQQHSESLVCDLCKKDGPQIETFPNAKHADWAQVIVHSTDGLRWGYIDVCPACIEERLLPCP